MENKETVIFGTIDPVYDDVRQIITEFTKQSDNYKLESKVYGDYDSFHKALISGESPDVFMYWNSADMYMYANSGAFANMYDYMDKYGGFSKEDVRDHIIEAFEYKDGLYGISAEFQIIPYIANGSCPEGAWEFINYIMSAEYQENTLGALVSGSFVTRKDSFERNLNRFQQTKSIEGEVHYFHEVLDEEALETFIPYLDTCTVLRHHDGYITYIMDEEFDEFINGNISAQECADRIQSRVSIYLAEQW